MRPRSIVLRVALLALSALAVAPDAVASTGPGTVLFPVTPVAPVVHRGYPCVLEVNGTYDQYVQVTGQTAQTRTGIAYFYSAADGHLIWRIHLRPEGYAYRQTSRGQNVGWYIATINGIRCGPAA